MTLVELVVAIVIISVALTGVVLAFSATVKGSSDPLIHKQMLAIAEELIEEITLKPFEQSDPPPTAGCDRSAFNDIRDYQGYSCAPITDIEGTPMPGLGSYGVSVTVVDETSITGSTRVAALAGLGAGSALRITVTVTNGAQSMQLLGWRTVPAP